jgi:hypothetical protein
VLGSQVLNSVSVAIVESKMWSKRDVVANCLTLYDEVLDNVNSCHIIILIKSSRGIRQGDGNKKCI